MQQLIGSLERKGAEIRVGAPIPEFVRVIRDWHRTQLSDMLQREWSPDETLGERLEWSAICWAIVHMEWSASEERRGTLRSAFDDDAIGRGGDSRATRAILRRKPEKLAEQVNEHIALKRFPVDRVRAVGDER